MGGAAARPPVAITARRKRSRLPSTSIASGPAKRPSPMKTSTPRSRKRAALSCGAMPARNRRIRSIAKPKSPAVAGAGGPPKSVA